MKFSFFQKTSFSPKFRRKWCFLKKRKFHFVLESHEDLFNIETFIESFLWGLKKPKNWIFVIFGFFHPPGKILKICHFCFFFQNFRQQIFQALGLVGSKNQKWQKFDFLASLSPKEQFSPNFNSISHFGCSWAIFKKSRFLGVFGHFWSKFARGTHFWVPVECGVEVFETNQIF